MTNKQVINTGLVNGTGELVAVGIGLLFSIEQTVQLRLSTADAGEQLFAIEQTVQTSVASQVLFSIEQTVRDLSVPSFYTRNGWYPIIVLDGGRIPDNQLHGTINYTHAEDNSALLDFTIIPPVGTQDLFAYQGKSVSCSIQTAAGTYKIFTGKVDIPDIDIIGETITLRCSDNREERLDTELPSTIPTIGLYSTTIFGDVTSDKQEVQDRLSTIPYSLDWNGYGTPHLTAWTPKASADYTLSDSSIFRTQPTIRLESRASLLNKVTIDFTYNYQRYHHRQIAYEWAAPYQNSPEDFLVNGYSMLRRSMVEAAVQAAGWPVRNQITYTDILPSGIYKYFRGTEYVTRIWSTEETQGINTPVLDKSGNQVYVKDPTDPTKQLAQYQFLPTSSVDNAKLFCFGAEWLATKRWAQNMQEHYTLTVTAPQSSSRYGTIERDESYTQTAIDQSDDWENYPGYKNPPSGSGITASTYYIDGDNGMVEFSNATRVAIMRAKTAILRSHRDSRVTFDRTPWPQIDLRHTVALTATRVQCKGKVSKVQHRFDVTTGEGITSVELALYRATGSQSESNIVAPTRPTDTPDTSHPAINLDSHYGLDPSTTAGASKWTGHIGNKWVTVQNGTYVDHRKTTYQEQFIVDTPPIETAVRDTRKLEVSQTYNISIPSNNLVLVTQGK